MRSRFNDTSKILHEVLHPSGHRLHVYVHDTDHIHWSAVVRCSSGLSLNIAENVWDDALQLLKAEVALLATWTWPACVWKFEMCETYSLCNRTGWGWPGAQWRGWRVWPPYRPVREWADGKFEPSIKYSSGNPTLRFIGKVIHHKIELI